MKGGSGSRKKTGMEVGRKLVKEAEIEGGEGGRGEWRRRVLRKVEGGRGQVAAFQDMGWLELGSKVECPSQGHASLPLLGKLCPPWNTGGLR